jgi:hypothetical protein
VNIDISTFIYKISMLFGLTISHDKSIQLLYGFERNSIFIVPRGPEAKPREIVGVEGDKKNAISQKTIQ